MTPHTRNRRGFTAVEIVVVVVLAAVIAGIGAVATAHSRSGAAVAVLQSDLDHYRLRQQMVQAEGGRVAATPSELAGFATSPRVTTLAAARLGERGYMAALRHPGTPEICVLSAPDGQGTVRCGEPEPTPAALVASGALDLRLATGPGGGRAVRLVAGPEVRAAWSGDSTTFVVVSDAAGRTATVPVDEAAEGRLLVWTAVDTTMVADGAVTEPVVPMSVATRGATGDTTALDVYLVSAGGRLMAAGAIAPASSPTPRLALSKVWAGVNTTITADGAGSDIPAGVKSWKIAFGSGSTISGTGLPIRGSTVYRRAGTYPLRLTITDRNNATVTLDSAITVSTAAAPVSAALSALAIEPTSPAAGEWATVTVTVRDVNGAAVAGRPVTVTLASGGALELEQPTATTNAEGVVTGRVRGSVVGLRTVGASVQGTTLTATAALTVLGGAPSAATSTMESTTFVAGAEGTVRATVRDAAGNVLAGVPVTFAADGVPVVVAPSAVTNAEGVATATVTGTAAGEATVVARVAGADLAQATVSVEAAAATALEIAAAPTSVPNGGVLTPAPQLALRDAWGNRVAEAGVTVTATLASGSATLSGSTATTDATGVATFGALRLVGASGPVAIAFGTPGLDGALIGGLALVNLAPSVGAIECATAETVTGETVTCSAATSDPEGQTLTHEWSADGLLTSVGASASYYRGTPGVVAVGLVVTDAQGAATTATGTSISFANRGPSAPVMACSNDNPLTNETVTCTVSGSTDPDGGTITYVWSATDRTGAATGTTTTYRRTEPGPIPVTVQAQDGQGGSTSAGGTITVWNQLPQVIGAAYSAGQVALSQPVAFTATATDADGTVVEICFDFYRGGTMGDDVSIGRMLCAPAVNGQATVTTSFAQAGPYWAVMYAVDDRRESRWVWGRNQVPTSWSTNTTVNVSDPGTTNYYLLSEDHTPIGASHYTASPNSVANPLTGTMTADAYYETATNPPDSRYLNVGKSLGVQSTTWTYSAYMKPLGTGDNSVVIWLFAGGFGSQWVDVRFDLRTGEASVGGATDGWEVLQRYTIPAGNGWYRVVAVFRAPTPPSALSIMHQGLQRNWAMGDPSKGFALWGQQLEPRYGATSYVAAGATPGTRP